MNSRYQNLQIFSVRNVRKNNNCSQCVMASRINTCSLFVENAHEKEVSKKSSKVQTFCHSFGSDRAFARPFSLKNVGLVYPKKLSFHSDFQFLKLNLFRFAHRLKCVGINDIIDLQKGKSMTGFSMFTMWAWAYVY